MGLGWLGAGGVVSREEGWWWLESVFQSWSRYGSSIPFIGTLVDDRGRKSRFSGLCNAMIFD